MATSAYDPYSCGIHLSARSPTFKKALRYCAMDGEAKIVEVSFFGGKILVTFADGMMAMLEPGQIRQLAVESNALTPLPTDDIPS